MDLVALRMIVDGLQKKARHLRDGLGVCVDGKASLRMIKEWLTA